MKRELRDALDIAMEVFNEDHTLEEMKKEAEKRMVKVFDITDSLESDVNDAIANINESSSDREYDLKMILDILY